jgi:N4-(beta-N-acetylglucosaminyl)-L-asparaginase
MRHGMKPQAAAEDAVRRIARRVPGYVGAVFAVNKAGYHGAACYGWQFQYAYQDAKSAGVQVVTVNPLPPPPPA